jgi:hypothetical protein
MNKILNLFISDQGVGSEVEGGGCALAKEDCLFLT